MPVSKIRFAICFTAMVVLLHVVLASTEAKEPFEDPRLKPALEKWNSIQNQARQKGLIRPGELGPQAASIFPQLRELLPGADSRAKLKLAEAIWRISGETEESTIALLAIIREDEEYGPYTAGPFDRMGPAAFSAFPAIVDLLKDPREPVRECAIKILGSFGPQHKLATEDHLLAALNDKSPQVRIAASEALLKIDGELAKAVESLVEIISQPMEIVPAVWKATPAELLLVSAIQAIGRFEGDAVDAVMPLSIHLDSRNINVREAAASALEKIGPGAELAIPRLGNAMRDTESISVPLVHYVISAGDAAAKALRSIGPAAVPTLLHALNDRSTVVRVRAIRELGGMKEAVRQTAMPLTAKLSDKRAAVRVEAIKALGKLGKDANLAAPSLTKFLFVSEELTSFPSGGGIGFSEQISAEALRALRSIEATEAQVVPALLDALGWKVNPTLESIAVIRQYPNRIKEFAPPLRRMLVEKNLGAACALASLGAMDPQIQAVLAQNLFDDENVDLVAAISIGQLIAHGEILDDDLHARLIAWTKASYVPLSIRTILLRSMPDDKANLESLFRKLGDARLFTDVEAEFEQAEMALLELIGHPNILDALVQELDNRTLKFLAARILIASGNKLEQAFACLENEAAVNFQSPAFGRIADFLGNLPPSEQSQSLLLKLLERHDGYILHGDFYRNGVEMRVVGDRAALALVRHKAASALLKQLVSTDALVRVRVLRALGACGVEVITPGLLELVHDVEPSVRLEVVKAIGRIGLEHPEMRDDLRPALKTAIKDRRRSVSDEAIRTLKGW